MQLLATVDVNCQPKSDQNPHGSSPLMKACMMGHLTVVEHLLVSGNWRVEIASLLAVF